MLTTSENYSTQLLNGSSILYINNIVSTSMHIFLQCSHCSAYPGKIVVIQTFGCCCTWSILDELASYSYGILSPLLTNEYGHSYIAIYMNCNVNVDHSCL